MKFVLTRILALLLLVFLSFEAHTQTDSTTYATYDVIHLKAGGIRKGQILSFNENNGVIVFLDSRGGTYTFTTNDYSYFEENIAFQKKKEFVLKERKESGFEYHIGFNLTAVNMNISLTPDSTYDSGPQGGYSYINGSVRIGAGKYINRQNFLGVTADLGLTSGLSNYFSGGLRYSYQYDGYKKNVAFYVPVELKFTSYSETASYYVIDSIGNFGAGEFNYTTPRDVKTNFKTIDLKIGQGFSFIMNNKNSLNIELFFMKSFILSSKMIDVNPEPKRDVSINGFGVSLLYNI